MYLVCNGGKKFIDTETYWWLPEAEDKGRRNEWKGQKVKKKKLPNCFSLIALSFHISTSNVWVIKFLAQSQTFGIVIIIIFILVILIDV